MTQKSKILTSLVAILIVFYGGFSVGGKFARYHAKYGHEDIGEGGCGGNAGRGLIFRDINHVEYYMPGVIALYPYINEEDFRNLLREIIKTNFAKCFSGAENPDAVSFNNMGGGRVMNNDHTLVVILKSESVLTPAQAAQQMHPLEDIHALTPVELPELGQRPALLTIEMYRKGAPSNVQTNALAIWTQSILIPQSANTEEVKKYLTESLYKSIRPQATFDGSDNIASKLYHTGFFENLRNWFMYILQVLGED